MSTEYRASFERPSMYTSQLCQVIGDGMASLLPKMLDEPTIVPAAPVLLSRL